MLSIEIQKKAKFANEFLGTKLMDVFCKHMILNNCVEESRADKLLKASNDINYAYCEWGSHNGHSSDILYHLNDHYKNGSG